MHSSRKYNYPYPPHGWSLEISREWEVSKANILNIYEARLEFPGGWGFKPWGREWIFSGTTQSVQQFFQDIT